MKVRCHREGLLSAFQLASAAIASRDVKPILQNLKAIANPDRFTLLGTDLELGIRLEVRGVNVEEPGDALLPASRVLAILRESIDNEMMIEVNEKHCLVKGEANEFEMGGEDPSGFADVPAFTDEAYHELPAGMLREMIRRTIFAAAVENPRYAVTGILSELEDGNARTVATPPKDRHTLFRPRPCNCSSVICKIQRRRFGLACAPTRLCSRLNGP